MILFLIQDLKLKISVSSPLFRCLTVTTMWPFFLTSATCQARDCDSTVGQFTSKRHTLSAESNRPAFQSNPYNLTAASKLPSIQDFHKQLESFRLATREYWSNNARNSSEKLMTVLDKKASKSAYMVCASLLKLRSSKINLSMQAKLSYAKTIDSLTQKERFSLYLFADQFAEHPSQFEALLTEKRHIQWF